MRQSDQLRETLAKIAELVTSLAGGDEGAEGEGGGHEDHESEDGESELSGQTNGATAKSSSPGCVLKSLPERLLVRAAAYATDQNPVNAPALSFALGDGVVLEPLQIAVLTAKYWGPAARTLSVSFMESAPADLKARIIIHLNAWSKTGGIKFAGTNAAGDVRISRGSGGFYSYLGTDIKLIPMTRQTMNLQGFTMSTPESEYKRVVRHEAGHTLGFPHEHARKAIVARIDPAKAYKWFLTTYGWDKATVDAQVLTPLNEASLMRTPPDQTSIMCYQLPGTITKDGKPILGGADINKTDYAFAGRIYPKPVGSFATPAYHSHDAEGVEWPEEEDVHVMA